MYNNVNGTFPFCESSTPSTRSHGVRGTRESPTREKFMELHGVWDKPRVGESKNRKYC